MASENGTNTPEVGQAVRVRNRLATVRAVEPYDSRAASGPTAHRRCRVPRRLPLSRSPSNCSGRSRPRPRCWARPRCPSVDANRPDSPTALQAFVNAHRWTRLNRLRESEGIEDEPLLGVWNSAIQVHPYQLGAGAEGLGHAPCQPAPGRWRGPRQDDPVRAGAGRTAPAAAHPPHPRPLPGHAPAAVEVRASPQVQPRLRGHRLRLDLPASPPPGDRHQPLESLPPHHHVDGLPADARRAAAVPPGVRGRA